MDKTNVDTEITLSANSSTAANLCDQCCQDQRGKHRDYCHLINLIKHCDISQTTDEHVTIFFVFKHYMARIEFSFLSFV